jgi:hypothetical protein
MRPRREQGEASGILSTAPVIGPSLSVAMAGAVFAAFGANAAGSLLVASGHTIPATQVQALQQTFVVGLHTAFVVCAALAAISILTSLVRGHEQAATMRDAED